MVDVGKGGEELYKKGLDLFLNWSKRELFIVVDVHDLKQALVALNEWNAWLERFPQHQAIDVPGEKIPHAFVIGLLVRVNDHGLVVRRETIGLVWQLDLTGQSQVTVLIIERQIAALALAFGALFDGRLSERQVKPFVQNLIYPVGDMVNEGKFISTEFNWRPISIKPPAGSPPRSRLSAKGMTTDRRKN